MLGMTKKRRILLETLNEKQNPMNAAQIHFMLQDEMDLATIYRGLEHLEKEHYLQSFVFECHHRGIERYYYPHKEVHELFLHCEDCHEFILLGKCPVEPSLGQMEKESGCRILDHQLIVRGLCQNCFIGEKDESEK